MTVLALIVLGWIALSLLAVAGLAALLEGGRRGERQARAATDARRARAAAAPARLPLAG